MNDKIDNIQITMDGFSEILSEIMIEIRSLKKEDSGESALNADLLNKIVQTIDESKKGVTGEGGRVKSIHSGNDCYYATVTE